MNYIFITFIRRFSKCSGDSTICMSAQVVVATASSRRDHLTQHHLSPNFTRLIHEPSQKAVGQL